jgi:hypothetical protein
MRPLIEKEQEVLIWPHAKAEMMAEGFWQPVEVEALIHTAKGSHYRVRLANGSLGKAALGTLKFGSADIACAT